MYKLIMLMEAFIDSVSFELNMRRKILPREKERKSLVDTFDCFLRLIYDTLRYKMYLAKE